MQIIQALFVSTLMTGLVSQKIVTDNFMLMSPCITGARDTVDTYLFTGTIGDNITTALNRNWLSFVLINVLRTTSQQYKTICQLFLGTGTCQAVSANSFIKCVCSYNTTTDQAQFTVSDAVQANDSNATIYVQWQHQNGTVIYSDNSDKNHTFPVIYDVNAAQLNLTVAGMTGSLPSGLCSFSLTLNKSNDLELCCSNTAMHCYPQISFNGAVITNTTEACVTYPASRLASTGATVNLVLSYSVCNRTDYRQGSNCTVTRKPDATTTESTSTSSITADVTTTTTDSSSSSSNAADERTTTTESSSSSSHTTGASTTTTESSMSSSHTTGSTIRSDDNKLKEILPAVLVTLFVVIIIIVVIVYCYKKKKRSEVVSNPGTNENEVKANASEYPQTDRQFPVHTNQAYDGRKSSPSEVTIEEANRTTHDNVQQHNTVQNDSNNHISSKTNDGSGSQTVPGNPRQLPPLKKHHTHGHPYPTTAELRPTSIETTSPKAEKL